MNRIVVLDNGYGQGAWGPKPEDALRQWSHVFGTRAPKRAAIVDNDTGTELWKGRFPGWQELFRRFDQEDY